MSAAIRVKCPGCKKILRIPADYAGRAVRCKHCGLAMRVKSKSKRLEEANEKLELDDQPTVEVDSGVLFAAEDDDAIVRVPPRFRSRRYRWVALAVGVGLLVLLATGVFYALPHVRKMQTDIKDAWTDNTTASANVSSTKPAPATPEPKAPALGPFPRRLLAICAHNYVYANPVSYGNVGGEQNFHTLVERLSRALGVPDSQILEVSDVPASRPAPASAPAKTKGKTKPGKQAPAVIEVPACPPSKQVLEQTIKQFLGSCRPQDRAIIFFVGHVIELDGEGYLVPLEGDMTSKGTLVSLAWLYQRLEECKARQKVLILDTCRLDPGRGLERPGSGPLGVKLDGQLAKPPAGVQVWSSCVAEQYSYEEEGAGVFLEALTKALNLKVIPATQEPADPLPVQALAKEVERFTTIAAAQHWSAKQTSRLSGTEPVQGAPYNRDDPLPAKLELPSFPKPAEGMASPKEIARIFQEIDLPPMRNFRHESQPLHFDALLSFSATVMEPYVGDNVSIKDIKASPNKYPLRLAVVEALEAMRNGFNPRNDAFALQDSLPAGNSERRKKEIFERQMKPAKVLGLLIDAQDNLRKAGEERDGEPSKRWQAHYDYVLAELLARMAYIHEYELMLGKIRKDELPELKPNIDTGWRLASKDKPSSGKEVKELVTESRKILAKIIKQQPGTPWAVLARRAELTALGLEWRPTR